LRYAQLSASPDTPSDNYIICSNISIPDGRYAFARAFNGVAADYMKISGGDVKYFDSL
jgi:hypothetical protein